MKQLFTLALILLGNKISFAQKKVYDVLTYDLPKGWRQNEALSKAMKDVINTTNSEKLDSSVVSYAGLWVDYSLEKNANQQYTTGYLRKEYRFNADGTYSFRKKNFLSNSAEIYFVNETGTYTVKENQLTIIPQKGRTEFWSKPKSLKNTEWGKLVKYANHSLERVTYTVEYIEDPNYSNSIILKPGKPTVRDGGQFNAPGAPYSFHYSFRKLESLIDSPPGFKK